MFDHLLYLSEQHKGENLVNISDTVRLSLSGKICRKTFYHRQEMLCFQVTSNEQDFTAETNYFVGVDWLVPGQTAVYVQPKLNGTEQVDFLGMLLHSMESPESLAHIDGLFHVDFDNPWITIPEQQDRLSPLLVIQFLKVLQSIVRKGLKKSYYRLTQNLQSRVKGKILIAPQIRENLVKNRRNKMVCNFQEYGVNNTENQFLKLVVEFVSGYLSRRHHYFTKPQQDALRHILQYCLPAFEQVDALALKHQRIPVSKNVFYTEYEEAVKTGEYILRRFSFNINATSERQQSTPPFWIDMSKLFELYVYRQLKQIFPLTGQLSYQDSFRGKQTDILVRAAGYKCVIDCKYKPRYAFSDPSLDDKRQVAGYARLRRVYDELEIPYHELVKALVIYADQNSETVIRKDELFSSPIEEYVQLYKFGIRLPVLSIDT